MIYIADQREHLRGHDRRARFSTSTGATLRGVHAAHVHCARRRSFRRSAGVERGHRQESVDATTSRSRRTGARCMTTAGGLVFTGGTNDRMFRAFDASTGKVLWEFPTNSGIFAPADILRHRRQAVHRGAVGMGPGRQVDADAHRRRISRQLSGSARRWRSSGCLRSSNRRAACYLFAGLNHWGCAKAAFPAES